MLQSVWQVVDFHPVSDYEFEASVRMPSLQDGLIYFDSAACKDNDRYTRYFFPQFLIFRSRGHDHWLSCRVLTMMSILSKVETVLQEF